MRNISYVHNSYKSRMQVSFLHSLEDTARCIPCTSNQLTEVYVCVCVCRGSELDLFATSSLLFSPRFLFFSKHSSQRRDFKPPIVFIIIYH